MSADETIAFSDPLLRNAVFDALLDAAPNAALTSDVFDADETSSRHWRLAAEMGWTSVLVQEDVGGMGLGLAHVADICEAMGRHLFCGPFAESGVLIPALAREIGCGFAALLPGVASGEIRIGYAESAVAGQTNVDGLIISPVEHAPAATHLLFVDSDDTGAMHILLVESGQMDLRCLQPMDPTVPVAQVTLDNRLQGERHVVAAAAAERVLASMHVAVAADLLGIGEASLGRAVEHAKTRKQFGQAIGAFQAVKHRLADCRTALSSARLAIAYAVRDSAVAEDARLARILAADAAINATATALHTHGGAGFSWELDLHLYLKRARRLNSRNGGTTFLRGKAGDVFIERALARA